MKVDNRIRTNYNELDIKLHFKYKFLKKLYYI